MSFLNLMRNKLKPKEVNDALSNLPEVTANPEGEATTTLEKLGIDKTIYSVGGGGAGLTMGVLDYTGQDENTNEITFPVEPLFFMIENQTNDSKDASRLSTPYAKYCFGGSDTGCFQSYNSETKKLSLTGGFPVNTTARRYCNFQTPYKVYYWY